MSQAPRQPVDLASEQDPHNAYITLLDEPLDPETEGPLAGLRVAIKDNLALKGLPLTCASHALEEHTAPYTATCVQRVIEEGASITGKTNMDEFAAGSRGERSAFGPTENPAAPGRVPGGSSSGSAAAVASGHADAALGTDTGGSLRSPGACTGTAALKPTNGRVSRWGLVDLAMSLDQPGPIAQDVATLARVFDAIAGPDPRDPTTHDHDAPPTLPRAQHPDLHGATIGHPTQLPDGVTPDTKQAFQDALGALQDHGATLEPVPLPDSEQALCIYYVTCYAEFASAMHKFDGTLYGAPGAASRTRLGDEIKRRILLGTFITAREQRSAWYERALAARNDLQTAWTSLFDDVDLVATPTLPTPPPKRGQAPDALEEYAADVLTVHANLAQLPAGTIPMATLPDGPVGLQLIGPHGADARVIEAMAAHQEAHA